MYFKEHWEKSRERFKALWEGEIIDRCCMAITAPKTYGRNCTGYFPETQEDRINYWTDGEWILKRRLKSFENTCFIGDAFPVITLNLGAAGHAAYFMNARFTFEENTVWFFPSILDWDADLLQFDPESFMYKKTVELAEYLAAESGGRYFVSMPDIGGNLDALAHLRGTENILMEMITDEDRITAAMQKIQTVWEKTCSAVFNRVKAVNEGGSCIGWLNTWAPGLHSQMQCDLSAMIPPEFFRKYAMPELTMQSDFLDYPLYHLDGIEQIRHLDMLLSIKKLKIIQWTCVAGQPSPLEFIPVLRKIQKAGKGLVIDVRSEEVEPLLEQLSSKGLYLLTHVSSKDEADFILRKAEKLTHE